MLAVNAIDLHYGAAQALRSVTLAAEAGKVTCVPGRNGVGKTSLLRALTGHHDVTRGTITFDRHDITRLQPYARARRGIGHIAIVLVEQYLDCARELGERFAVMERGSVVYSCRRETLDEGALRRALAL